jgi:GTP cyclohydrolase III
VTQFYLAVDGDNVGSHLEYFTITNDTDSLTQFSAKFNAAMIWFQEQLVTQFQATVFFSGGDNLLARITANGSSVERLEKLRIDFADRAQSTLSMGLGESPQRAYLALKLAKTSGKNSIRQL